MNEIEQYSDDSTASIETAKCLDSIELNWIKKRDLVRWFHEIQIQFTLIQRKNMKKLFTFRLKPIGVPDCLFNA